MSRVHLTSGAVVLWLAAGAAVQADRTDDFINAELRRQNIPGLSLAVIRNGQVVKTAGYGVTSLESRGAATPDTIYHVGSISKQFVAAGIMLLAQEGRLRLDDRVGTYLDDLPAAWRGITIRHLLTHTSGLVRNAPGLDPRKDERDEEVMRTAYSVPLQSDPGERWAYSNLGYSLAGAIVSRVSGRPWHEFLSERLFKPSGMTMTYPANTNVLLPNRATGYTDNDSPRRVGDWQALIPAGGFLSTVTDLAKYEAALRSERILTRASQRQMWTPVALGNGTTYPYGLGWELDSLRPGATLVRHGGLLSGFRAEYARLVEHDVTIVILMNSDDVDWRAILERVASDYLPGGAPPITR